MYSHACIASRLYSRASALVGPSILTHLRSDSYNSAATALAGTCDPAAFTQAFGSPPANLPSLLETKTVTISKLMEIAPVGTVDPTPSIYDSTMFAMSGVMGAALLCNALIAHLRGTGAP